MKRSRQAAGLFKFCDKGKLKLFETVLDSILLGGICLIKFEEDTGWLPNGPVANEWAYNCDANSYGDDILNRSYAY